MNITYIDEYQQVLYHNGDTDMVPRPGDMVFLKDIFYVKNVVWYPEASSVHVHITEHELAKPKVAESKEKVVNLAEVRQIKETADTALRASKKLTVEISNIRTYLNTQPKAPTKNDT